WDGRLDPAFQDDHRPCAEGHVESLLRPLRLRCERYQHQTYLVLQQYTRSGGEEEDHLELARLSRLGRHARIADRPCRLPQCIRPAPGPGAAYGGALLLQTRRSFPFAGAVLAVLRGPA